MYNRRNFIKYIALAMPFFLKKTGIANAQELFAEQSPDEFFVYFGTYTNGKSKGIYVYRFKTGTGKLEFMNTMPGIENPSFLTFGHKNRYLYAVSETGKYNGKTGGSVNAYAVNSITGELAYLNTQPSHGGSPCHITVDKSGGFALLANYNGGNAAVYPVMPDGSLGASSDMIQHTGSSVVKGRQDAPHTHCVTIDPSNTYVFLTDLGIDKIMIYRFDRNAGKLLPNVEPFVSVKPGSGPRHLTFHPNGKFAYLIQELNSTMTAFSYDNIRGALTEIQSVSTLPENYTKNNSCAEIVVHPSGKFVYGSNRGHDSIAAFAVDENTGMLTFIAHESSGGKTPRNFTIDPTGTYLLTANQNSDNIVVFKIDHATGLLQKTDTEISIPAPVCIAMIPAL